MKVFMTQTLEAEGVAILKQVAEVASPSPPESAQPRGVSVWNC